MIEDSLQVPTGNLASDSDWLAKVCSDALNNSSVEARCRHRSAKHDTENHCQVSPRVILWRSSVRRVFYVLNVLLHTLKDA